MLLRSLNSSVVLRLTNASRVFPGPAMSVVLLALLVGISVAAATVHGRLAQPTSSADAPVASAPSPPPSSETLLLRGRVVWVAEALERLHGIRTVPEASEHQLALETAAGDLHPLVEDIRGRAFRRDARLRGMDAELLVRRHRGSPLVQVIQVFELTENGRSELDYWCEICAIAMFELKACDCCQGPTELRKRPVNKPAARDAQTSLDKPREKSPTADEQRENIAGPETTEIRARVRNGGSAAASSQK